VGEAFIAGGCWKVVAKPLNISKPQKPVKWKNQAKGGSIQQQNQKFYFVA
jgi:hypothetical protein